MRHLYYQKFDKNRILLITCRFLVIFLVVSKKKRNFAVRY